MHPSTYDFSPHFLTREDIISYNLVKTEVSRTSTKSYMKYDKKQKRGF